MKKINNLIKIMVLFGVISFTSCETTELDLTENPNALSPSQADPDFFLNFVQVNFASFVESTGSFGGRLTRVQYMNGRDYLNAYSANSFNGIWSTAYSTIMKDLSTMNTLAEEKGMNNHIAMGKVMQAYVMITLVDLFGDVPYTEALDFNILNPNLDPGADVYAAALTLLDEAIAGFDNNAPDPQYDFYYNRNWDGWIKAANSIKLKAYSATRLVDPAAVGNFNAIIASGNYITNNSEDFQFQWGTQLTTPDTRHPSYRSDYTRTGGNSYRSNWLMNHMRGDFPSALLELDPRVFSYFYRQVGATPGIDAPANEEVLECGLIAPPAHYAGYVYCSPPWGWWGRDHGNDNGIPPDGFMRTLVGVYPAGGAIDELSPTAQTLNDGRGGDGITPVLLASWIDFWIAEQKALIDNDMIAAKTFTFNGMVKSINKVWDFEINPGVTPLVKNWFLADMDAKWNASTDEERKEIMSTQFFVATYGNSIDAYNFYRRTGYPKTLQPNIEPNPGNFPKSMWLPANSANNNANINQKSDLSVQVFWDNNPTTGFPVAN